MNDLDTSCDQKSFILCPTKLDIQQSMYFGAAIFSCDTEIICELQITLCSGVLEIQGWTSEQGVRSSALGTNLTEGVGVICDGKMLFHGRFSLKYWGVEGYCS